MRSTQSPRLRGKSSEECRGCTIHVLLSVEKCGKPLEQWEYWKSRGVKNVKMLEMQRCWKCRDVGNVEMSQHIAMLQNIRNVDPCTPECRKVQNTSGTVEILEEQRC